jgi:endoglucanase
MMERHIENAAAADRPWCCVGRRATLIGNMIMMVTVKLRSLSPMSYSRSRSRSKAGRGAAGRGARPPLGFWGVGLVALACLAADPAGGQPLPAAKEPPPSIRLNSLGYLPESLKQATVTERGERFVVRDARTGEAVGRGPVTPLGSGSPTGGQAFVADFSGIHRAGRFRLEIPGVGVSAAFDVAEDVYNRPFYWSARAMYLWRCGTAVEGRFAGQTFRHPACHLEDGYLDYAEGRPGEVANGVGGWHDAGDYGKYTGNGAFSAGMMLLAWEHFHDRLAAVELNIPESAGGTPDLLHEARWELEWLLKMQAGDGRVYHKLTALAFAGFIRPEQDTARRYFTPWGSAATADFAAVMAQAARVYRPFDKDFADRCLAAAEKSYRFLRDHPQDHPADLEGFSTGGYQTTDPDDRVWAAAELWETTGREAYLRDFERQLPGAAPARRASSSLVDTDWDWSNVRNLGTFTYLLSSRPGRDPALLSRVRADALGAADELVDAARRHEFGRPLGDHYYWGCNGTVARVAINLHVADCLAEKPEYRATMLRSLDYLFGRNPYGRSFVTGLGDHPPRFPHDRRSGSDDVDPPWPGYLVGGPWPTATDWHDDWTDYRTNEIAINWNSALIYALAAFVERPGAKASVAEPPRPAGEPRAQCLCSPGRNGHGAMLRRTWSVRRHRPARFNPRGSRRMIR